MGRATKWATGHEQIPTVKFDGAEAVVSGVRDFRYENCRSHEARWKQRVIDLSTTVFVDFIVVPFAKHPDLAHTMVSFGFEDGSYLAISVEARRREGQPFSLWKGQFGVYPLTYIIAEERDCIAERIECRGETVHLYRSAATAQQSQKLLSAMLHRANQLAESPERYNLLFNNCLTNLRNHVNAIWPNRIPWGWDVLFTGHSDHLAHSLGILCSNSSFESLHEQANISDLAKRNVDLDDFSRVIRSRIPKQCRCLL